MEDHQETNVPRLPVCKAILLCENSIIEAVTGKVSIIGIVDRFGPLNYPTRIPPFQAFVQITNAAGRYDITIEIHDLLDDTVIARSAGLGIQIDDRLLKANVVIPIPPLPLRHAGKYDLVIFANGQEIDRQTFAAVEVPHDDVPEDPSKH